MRFFLFCLVPLLAAGGVSSEDEKAAVALFVVQPSAESGKEEETITPYGPAVSPGAGDSMIALADSEPGTALLLVAYDRTTGELFGALPPVLEERKEGAPPVRFPQRTSDQAWEFKRAGQAVDFYAVVFPGDDENLEIIREMLDWLQDAVDEDDVETMNLHGLALKNRLGRLLRERSTGDYLVRYDRESGPEESEAKAAVTRGTTRVDDDPGNLPLSLLGGKERRLDTLDETWRDDARPIPREEGDIGVLLYPVVAR